MNEAGAALRHTTPPPSGLSHRRETADETAARWTLPEPLAVWDVNGANGTVLAVRRYGNPDGPRLLLTHGNGFAIDAYYPFWSRFTQQFDVCVYDLRNHGWNSVGDQRAHNVPKFTEDTECVLRDLRRRGCDKPTVGVYHSVSALMALRHACQEGRYSALVLFDVPVCPPSGFPHDMEHVGRRTAIAVQRRKTRFRSYEDCATYLAGTGMFDRVPSQGIDLFARATLRSAADGTGYQLRCPPAYEAQICRYIFCWSMTVDLSTVTCPTKVIGADPTVPNSYMPSMDIRELRQVDYDFLPDTTHLLQLERPEACSVLTIEFLEDCGIT